MTLNEASDLYFQYLRVEKGVSNETIRNYAYDLKQFFDSLHKRNTSDLKSGDIQEFIRIQTQNMLSIPLIHSDTHNHIYPCLYCCLTIVRQVWPVLQQVCHHNKIS